MWVHEILYADIFEEQTTFETIFVKSLKDKHGGRLKMRIQILFCGGNKRTAAL
jgi:hypothetical protein